MEDLPEGKVSDPVEEIDGMNCVWRKELAEWGRLFWLTHFIDEKIDIVY